MTALGLLVDRRFGPLFWSQFTVAFNDNLLKTGIIFLMTFGARTFGHEVRVLGMNADQLNPLAAAMLIVPFILFSASAGQLADKVSRRTIIVATKLAELIFMAVAAAGFAAAGLGAPALGLTVLVFLLLFTGAQSAIYGPAKYSIVPELVDESQLVTANALLQMGSYLAILGGVIAAGSLVALPGGPFWLGGSIVTVSLLGYLASRALPNTPAANPEQRVDWLSAAPSISVVRKLMANQVLRRSVTGISWFWAFGACLLTLFPVWTRDALNGNEALATWFMALFSVGIGAGSLLCNRLSPHGLELGLVAVGGIGLTLFPFLLWVFGAPFGEVSSEMGVLAFLQTWQGVVVSGIVASIAASGGLFVVPLYSLLQSRAADEERGQILAANNLVSSVYILVSQAGLIALGFAGTSERNVFLILAIVNLVGVAWLYTIIPEFLYRFLAWIIGRLMYRLEVTGIEKIPRQGACIIVCNHVTFVDWLIVGGACPRPTRFVMDKFMFQLPIVNRFVKRCKAIPIASKKVDPELLEKAWDRIAEELEAGNVVCIFPEGGLTRDGEPLEYRPGIEKIVERTPVPVVTLAMNGMWGSFFSRVDGAALKKPFRRGLRSRIWLTVHEVLTPDEVTVDRVRHSIISTWARRPEK
jgi:1-acyl-sn-glycerol-3-phosphate acyltransferase